MIDTAVCCHMGRHRHNNEDNFYLNGVWKSKEQVDQNWFEARSILQPALFAVFDGMGGAQYGEVAAHMAASLLHKHRDDFLLETDLEQGGAEKISQLNRTQWESFQKLGYQSGCTLAAVVLRDNELFWFGLGDSRIYLLEDGVLTRVTQDHTIFAEAERIGLTEDKPHPAKDARSHQLTQYFGMDCSEYDASPCHGCYPLRHGVRILLCSDGLYDTLEESEMARLLAWGTAEEAAQGLINLALDKDGRDNITAMVLIA